MSTYVVFGVMFVPFMAALLFRWRDPGARQIFVMIAVAAVFCVTWIARFRIVITEHTVEFRRIFTSSTLPRAAIRSARITFRASASRGPLRLVVTSDGGGEIDINAKVFSREAIAAVLALAPVSEPSAPTAERK
ncbi:MAG TPA: hypothetical protein VGR95_10920 [Thermoanaerobaculia bacterium]|nr:hypothetical protein [Thermoanaerobaculia bacterium]